MKGFLFPFEKGTSWQAVLCTTRRCKSGGFEVEWGAEFPLDLLAVAWGPELWFQMRRPPVWCASENHGAPDALGAVVVGLHEPRNGDKQPPYTDDPSGRANAAGISRTDSNTC